MVQLVLRCIFVPITEKSNGVLQIGDRVQGQACHQSAGNSILSIAVLLHGPYIHTEYLNFDAGGAVIAV